MSHVVDVESSAPSPDAEIGLLSARRSRRCSRKCCSSFLRRNIVLVLTIAGAALGFMTGALVGMADPSPTTVTLLKLPGNIFIRVLKALVLPLIISSIVVGVASLHKAGSGARLGARTFLFYFSTTVIAVVTGVIIVTIIHPGHGGEVPPDPSPMRNVSTDAVDVVVDILYALFPENLVEAALEMDVLGLILFAIVFAVFALRSGRKGKLLLDFIAGINKVILKIVHYVMYITPLGVFSLLTGRLAESGSEFWIILRSLGIYVLTVLAGLTIHGLLVLPLLYFIFVRKNPYKYLSAVAQALLTAFGTASSAATLPVSIESTEKAGVLPGVSRFVLPLGSTVNMDGTALYEAVAALFIAQTYGIALGFGSTVAIALTAILASVGAAGIPEAGLVTMMLVLKAADLPLEGIALLLPVDWLLDRCRTTINVWGDMVCAAVVNKVSGLLPVNDPGCEASHEPLPEEPTSLEPTV